MALLINKTTGEQARLLPTHIFGRQGDICNTQLMHNDVSRIHATILWDGERWLLKDASTNGTFLNGKSINPNSFTPLNKGDLIQFGNNQNDCWELSSTECPQCMLVPLQPGLPYLDIKQIIALPSEDNPEVIITESIDGHWICESPAGLAVLKSGDLVGTGSSLWRFIEAKPESATTIEPGPNDVLSLLELHFTVSQNEEHIRLKIYLGGIMYDFGERIHHYLLLLLARQRLVDRDRGIAAAEQGWLEKEVLCKMLGTDINHINIQHFRLRKQIADILPKHSQFIQFIETRVGQLRVGSAQIHLK